MFHKHKWEVVSTDYTPPIKGSFETTFVGCGEKLIMGVTHIYLKCKDCGDIKQKDVVGKFNPEKSQKETIDYKKEMNSGAKI